MCDMKMWIAVAKGGRRVAPSIMRCSGLNRTAVNISVAYLEV